MFDWEDNNIKNDVEYLMNDLMDLYKKLHAWVRYWLGKKYQLPADGTIPAHLFGNMWAQTWSNMINVVPEMQPESKVESLDKYFNERIKVYFFLKIKLLLNYYE